MEHSASAPRPISRGELFKDIAKINLTAVPYKGAAPAITDLIGGQIEVDVYDGRERASLVEAGHLRAIAVTSAERSPAFPNCRRLRKQASLAMPPRAGTACSLPPRPRPISSIGSTNRQRWPSNPTLQEVWA